MKNLIPVSVAGALALGAVAAHASIAAPSSGTSDAVLFAEVVSADGSTVVASYAGDTNKTVNQILSLSGTQTILGSDANLGKLFAADNTAAGDQLVWGIMGSEYPTNNTLAAGNDKLITTNNTNTLPALQGTKLTGLVNAYNAGLTSLNTNLGAASSIEGTNPAAAGVWDIVTQTAGLAFWGGALGNDVTLGTTANLYYLTGAGSTLKNLTATLEGTATLTSGGLVLAGPGGTPPVPLPPAVWLFGSGLLGLAGVARRKAKA